MIITEQLYAVLPIEMLAGIDWTKTYQTENSVRWNIHKTLFVISKPIDSDYLSELQWFTQSEVYNIVSADAFAGPIQPITGSL
jgi:hypothetical protein